MSKFILTQEALERKQSLLKAQQKAAKQNAGAIQQEELLQSEALHTLALASAIALDGRRGSGLSASDDAKAMVHYENNAPRTISEGLVALYGLNQNGQPNVTVKGLLAAYMGKSASRILISDLMKKVTNGQLVTVNGLHEAWGRYDAIDSKDIYNAMHFEKLGSQGAPITIGSGLSALYAFLPEIIIDMVMSPYMMTDSVWRNWIGGTVIGNGQTKQTVLYLETAYMPWTYMGETSTSELASLQYSEKQVSVKDVQVSWAMSDAALRSINVNMLEQMMMQARNQYNQKKSNFFGNILINGEQSDNSFAAPVVGVDTTGNELRRLDIDRIRINMRQLEMPANLAFYKRDLGVLEMQGTYEDRVTVEQYLAGFGMGMNTINLEADQLLLANREMGLVELRSNNLTFVESERSAKNRTTTFYLNDQTGGYIMKNDSRFILDYSREYATYGIPAASDAETRLTNTFKSAI